MNPDAPGARSQQPAKVTFYFPVLDGLRFFAFLLVFVHHLPPSNNPILSIVRTNGWVGVHLFLFLSAYLLTSILKAEFELKGKISVRNFYIRRGLRIWPLYFVFCFAMLALYLIRNPGATVDWPRVFGLLLFVDNIATGFYGYNALPYTAHLWTISLEEQFYLVLPFVLAYHLRHSSRLLLVLFTGWVLFVAMRMAGVALGAEHPLIWTSVISADALLLGTALGAIRLTPLSSGRIAIPVFFFGIVLLFSGSIVGPVDILGLHQVYIYSLVALGAAAIVLAALGHRVFAFLGSPLLAYLGKISFGLYVFHLLGIDMGWKLISLLGLSSWWSLALASLVCTTLVSVISYQLFERYFLLLKRKFESVHSRKA